MKINRVTLYNFSSYVGENTIALDTHGVQNIILIGGNNGAGKTSFFTAIKLALYGPQCFRFQDKNNRYTARIKELINHDAFLSNNVKSYVEVEIDLPTDRAHTLYTIGCSQHCWLRESRRAGHCERATADSLYSETGAGR